ncbi:DUF676-domain-containing protein [Sporormia fimetaria CBS 119925]|uniref:DUF676-domain-containing protein n=1 Tax=Sporormia fimetaria CBS 119925 TaxID=1340428 RepID=A0A6A6VFS4_9PLEO|nr:DUF676-domain-containing protein [Sporormia fimetaria CBS 119925]
MLLTPRTYSLAQGPDAGCTQPRSSYFLLTSSRKEQYLEYQRARRMLLLHQTGGVKVGEVVRYTVTYTPSEDRILPSPQYLHVKIRNCSSVALRAAYIHGPYTLHVAAYPSSFNPNRKVESPKRDGVPEFEPNLKAGASWTARLTVPEHIRETATSSPTEGPKSVTWILEVASQIIFTRTAYIKYEILLARDEKSLDLGFTAITGNSQGAPGQVQDHQQGKRSHVTHHPAQPKGIYSKAVKLVVDDTTSLWNTPALPELPHREEHRRKSKDSHRSAPAEHTKQKKIHLVILTHGLHSNLAADMLYMKESIDATVKQAREDRRKRRREAQAPQSEHDADIQDTSTAPLSGGQDEIREEDKDEDEEEVIVRGFSENVTRTERGIQYLGKRLAKFVLRETFPDQPFLPIKKSVGKKITGTFSGHTKSDDDISGVDGSSTPRHAPSRAYRYTSISFIGHSLGGLVQTYAIAYIHKHSPEFFDKIKPVNFVALASPFLGLSNENPMYVKFALDFGLVGRTGQDLGLTWRAPNIAKSGWSAMVGGLGANTHKEDKQADPGAKPLLRILPTGPAHHVLRRFRNRTVYSNVVNDGIVPLRTSCLLFLDWRGLGRVEKARRENGLIGTVVGWGWGQVTGQNSSPNPSRVALAEDENDRIDSPSSRGDDFTVPQPAADTTNEDDEALARASMSMEPAPHQFLDAQRRDTGVQPPSIFNQDSTLMTLWSYIRPSGKHTSKDKKMFKRSQTRAQMDEEAANSNSAVPAAQNDGQPPHRPRATRGDSVSEGTHGAAPPKTTIFESAGDLLNPPVPPTSWIIDPTTRARTIFHDRIYHPEDIPPPPAKRPKLGRSFSSESSMSSKASVDNVDDNGMRVEEKIARAYHKDLSWRKVLVRLEPDAHNNIIVRRMFANAYGWPVVKHLCDTHFADTWTAETRDEHEPATERARPMTEPVTEDGEQVKGQTDSQPPVIRTESELRESADELGPLSPSRKNNQKKHTANSALSNQSGQWDDSYFEGTSDEEDDDNDDRNAFQKLLQIQSPTSKNNVGSPDTPHSPEGFGTSEAEIADFLSASPPSLVDGHRGIGVSRRQSSIPSREPDSIESVGGGFMQKDSQAASPPQTPAGGILSLGLRKSLDVKPPGSPQLGRERSESSGVAAQVARLSLAKDQKDGIDE